MSHLDEEFDLDVRLHGAPTSLRAQANTEGEDCTAEDCPEPTAPHTCDGLAFTCNSCQETCEGPTFCGDTCDPAQTCRSCDCLTQLGCPTHGCLTHETCDQKLCLGDITAPPCGEEEETDESCGCQPGPGEGPDDDPDPGKPDPKPTPG
jgi:hypothetical protein